MIIGILIAVIGSGGAVAYLRWAGRGRIGDIETHREARERDQLVAWSWRRGDARDRLSWVVAHLLVALAIAALVALLLFRYWTRSYY